MDETKLAPFTGQTCDWYDAPCHLSGFAEWLLGALLFIPRKIFELITDALASLVGAIDIPFDTNALGNIPAGVSWFADITAAPEGFAIVLSALLARFALKLIPTLGF